MIQNILNKHSSDITEDDFNLIKKHLSTLEQQLNMIKRILTADTYVEDIYEMLVRYLDL